MCEAFFDKNFLETHNIREFPHLIFLSLVVFDLPLVDNLSGTSCIYIYLWFGDSEIHAVSKIRRPSSSLVTDFYNDQTTIVLYFKILYSKGTNIFEN